MNPQLSPAEELDLKVSADRIAAGEAVGEGYLYGIQAVQLLRRGMVTQADMRKYRSALYFAAKDAYGEARAKAMEAGWNTRHDEAITALSRATGSAA